MGLRRIRYRIPSERVEGALRWQDLIFGCVLDSQLQATRLSRRFFATFFRKNALIYENRKKVKRVDLTFETEQRKFLFYLFY